MSRSRRRRRRPNPPNPVPRNPIPNDRISVMLEDLVPDRLQGTDEFLDIINWNIRFFNKRDRERVELITNIMGEINADIFVLEEIEEGSLDPIAQALTDQGAGLYHAVYGTTGGQQRVAFMFDTEWVKASTNTKELFANEHLTIGTKEVFPRLPLHTKFVTKAEQSAFDFELVGVHLKSQRGGGGDQRAAAAKRLTTWLEGETSDEDVIIAGDWNSVITKPEWQPLRNLEQQGKISFEAFNHDQQASHLFKSGEGSRLDLVAVTSTVPRRDTQATVIQWNQLNDRTNILGQLIDKISDHLPVISRYYWNDTNQL